MKPHHALALYQEQITKVHESALDGQIPAKQPPSNLPPEIEQETISSPKGKASDKEGRYLTNQLTPNTLHFSMQGYTIDWFVYVRPKILRKLTFSFRNNPHVTVLHKHYR